MNRYAKHFKNTPQSEPLPDKTMVQNAAGGYVFEIDIWQRLRRFLILGCEGGSYYESERKLTLENAKTVIECIKADGKRTVDAIVEVSDKALAPKNDAATFALACATKFGNEPTRKLAFEALSKVCRIGTHLFQFAEAREAIGGGWGRGLRRAIGGWYDRKDLVTQALKYQQRGGWSHRDLLRLSHPIRPELAPVFDAICRPESWKAVKHPLVEGWLRIQSIKDPKEAAKIIEEAGLQREMIPTELLNSPEVWEALLPHLGLTALIRNLGNLSKVGLLKPLSECLKQIYPRLIDAKSIHAARVHPWQILLAAKTYARGRGIKGSGQWTVVPQIVEALDRAFYLAFHNIEPTNKRYLLGVDVSGSMGWDSSGHNVMSPAEGAAAMMMVTARTEPNYYAMGFSTHFKDLGIRSTDTLPDVLNKTRDHNFGGTDTSVAINWAGAKEIPVDVFVIYTDNETWAGDMHTCKALETYRKKMNLPTKLAVVAFTATNHSVADRADLNSMDFVGMDASLPQALSAFAME